MKLKYAIAFFIFALLFMAVVIYLSETKPIGKTDKSQTPGVSMDTLTLPDLGGYGEERDTVYHRLNKVDLNNIETTLTSKGYTEKDKDCAYCHVWDFITGDDSHYKSITIYGRDRDHIFYIDGLCNTSITERNELIATCRKIAGPYQCHESKHKKDYEAAIFTF